ncbi:hypothetical protein PIB30_055055 [Stylosanthes scabra]|uniref:Uncharacterized protein n=1 Tax=Stylosanthes scabra TaxID=79078 RepID=A0ABU6WH84_9FABA|nr:hypothetical protein [Stylosanthes scabra]
MERENRIQLLMEDVAQKDKELLELKEDNGILTGKKKEAEISKENHGYDMLIVGFERAKRQVEFLFPEAKFDKLDPVKVVHNGALIDDDEVDAEGGGDHDPEA